MNDKNRNIKQFTLNIKFREASVFKMINKAKHFASVAFLIQMCADPVQTFLFNKKVKVLNCSNDVCVYVSFYITQTSILYKLYF